ncbi:MAG: hypothetical protein ABFD54_12810 [Armatimonadota bacterium]|nr:hypothetical protein [bacterium]
MPSRCNLNLIVEKEECLDWSNLMDLLLSAITNPNLESLHAEVAEIASSLNKDDKNELDEVAEERLRIQHEIEKLQRRMAALGDTD